MKTVLSFLKPYKLHIFIAYSLTIIELVAELLLPFFLSFLINDGIIEQNIEKILFWSGMMLAITAITFISGILNSYFAAHVSVTSAYEMRKQLFHNIQRFTFEQLDKFPTSTLVTYFTNDVRQIQNTIFMALRIMFKAPFLVIGSVTMALIVNYKISAIFLVTIPLLVLFIFWVLRKGAKIFNLVQESIDRVNRILQENIAGMRVIKAFVRRNFESKRFTKANKTLADETQKAFRFVEASLPILFFVMNVCLVFILWYGNFQIQTGSTTVGDVVAIVNYTFRTVMAISLFTFITLAFSRAKASVARIETVLFEKDKASTTEVQSEKNDIIRGKIEFRNVTFSYPTEQLPVLEDVSFTVQPEEKLAIIGATGSGKTTLFQLIPRLYDPEKGEILLDDKNIRDYDIENLRNMVGYVAQSPLLFTGTIAENIKFGKEDATKEEIIQAAKDAQIHETIDSFPEKYDAIVGQKGVNLSGGQKQRISIARALIRKPKILLFDDSTSALDLQTENALLDAVTTYKCTILIITQKISTAKRADRILLLDDGKVLAIGSHEELLKSSELYQQIVASQSEKEFRYVH